VGEEYQPVGFGRAEVKGDGAHAFGVPFWQREVGVWTLKVDGVEGGNVFTLENHVALEFHLWVNYAGKAGELQSDIVVLIHHLGRIYKVDLKTSQAYIRAFSLLFFIHSHCVTVEDHPVQ